MLAVHAYDRTEAAQQFPSCPATCSTEDGRTKYGCRRSIPKGQPVEFELECWGCFGDAKTAGPCSVCDGGGRIEVRRCPHRMYGARELHVCAAADMLRSGHLPVAGGFGDMPAALWDAIGLVARVRHRIDEQRKGVPHGVD